MPAKVKQIYYNSKYIYVFVENIFALGGVNELKTTFLLYLLRKREKRKRQKKREKKKLPSHPSLKKKRDKNFG